MWELFSEFTAEPLGMFAFLQLCLVLGVLIGLGIFRRMLLAEWHEMYPEHGGPPYTYQVARRRCGCPRRLH